MPYNPETEQFYQAPGTVVDSTPDGDTVQEGFDDRLTPAMAGVYTDINLLKENGMIGVGIPATTTSRGIGRVATLADMEPGAAVENGPAILDVQGGAITPTPTAHAVPQADSDGTLNNWSGARFATCATAAATAAKEATLTGFSLVKGARVFVTFANSNTVAGALTLNVNGTGAKSIYNESGNPISATRPGYFPAGCKIEFAYDGTNWVFLDRVVENYMSGASWYDIYASGKIRQGGKISSYTASLEAVTLLKSMTTTNYKISATHSRSGASTSDSVTVSSDPTHPISTTGFYLNTWPLDYPVWWEVEGF